MEMDQLSEASWFHDENAVEVLRVRELLLQVGSGYLARPEVSGLLPAAEMLRAQVSLQARRPEGVLLAIRGQASAFVRAGLSGPYWDVVHALEFWSDALGSRWPYMTQERRKQYLAWAAEHAAVVK